VLELEVILFFNSPFDTRSELISEVLEVTLAHKLLEPIVKRCNVRFSHDVIHRLDVLLFDSEYFCIDSLHQNFYFFLVDFGLFFCCLELRRLAVEKLLYLFVDLVRSLRLLLNLQTSCCEFSFHVVHSVHVVVDLNSHLVLCYGFSLLRDNPLQALESSNGYIALQLLKLRLHFHKCRHIIDSVLKIDQGVLNLVDLLDRSSGRSGLSHEAVDLRSPARHKWGEERHHLSVSALGGCHDGCDLTLLSLCTYEFLERLRPIRDD
jgi:hypothetical protein